MTLIHARYYLTECFDSTVLFQVLSSFGSDSYRVRHSLGCQIASGWSTDRWVCGDCLCKFSRLSSVIFDWAASGYVKSAVVSRIYVHLDLFFFRALFLPVKLKRYELGQHRNRGIAIECRYIQRFLRGSPFTICLEQGFWAHYMVEEALSVYTMDKNIFSRFSASGISRITVKNFPISDFC